MSQHDLEAKSCPAHNFIIWSRILKLFHRNDHFIKTTCRKQDLGRYLEGQDHSLTLQQNRVRPITLLFEVGVYNYLTEMITIYWDDLSRTTFGSLPEGQGHSMTLRQNRVWPKTLLFEVGFYNYFIEMITILEWRVAQHFGVATLKVKVTAWTCSKSGLTRLFKVPL